MNRSEFLNQVREIASRETSSNPEGWIEGNPFWGHCVVVSLLAQDFFGGELLRATLEDTAFAHMGSHYWNVFSDGEIDFTQEQFGGSKPQLKGEIRTREYLLSNEDTLKRYEKLKMLLLANEQK